MNEEKKYPSIEEEENGLKVGEPAVGSFAYAPSAVTEEPDYDFGMRDLGLPRSLDDVCAEIHEAERELSDLSKWSPLGDFISEFKQEHASWLK